MATTEGQNSPFLRQLTSSEVELREKALETLKLFLTRATPFDNLELMKLWKGLFYCMWMTANPLPQQRLAQDLSSLTETTLSKQNVFPFLDAFWQTMVREWPNIDSHRINKYLRLCRLILRSSLLRLGSMDFASDALEKHNLILSGTPLEPLNIRIPDGIRYHVIDIFVDELDYVREQLGEDRLTTYVAEALLHPLEAIYGETKTTPVRKRAAEALSDERLASWGLDVAPKQGQLAEGGANDDDDDDFAGFD